VVVITNQSGIDLGLYDHTTVQLMHTALNDILRSHRVALTDIYYCPHHPSHGRCLCRKPGGLLLQRAAARYGIDLSRSVMIGDRQRDVEAAAAVGANGILVSSNTSLMDTLRANALV
jgi:D-glycero-D-manno-heptose 1,7-bisphosphate phosphatase